MHGGADSPRASPGALISVVVVVVAVLVLALVVKANQTGTIVVERIVLSASSTTGTYTQHSSSFATTEITETDANGADVRDLESNDFSWPGFQQVTAGQRIELYDPLDNTIFVTTQPAVQRAINQQMRALLHGGGSARSTSVQYAAAQRVFTPGRRSVYAQEVLAHRYRVIGRTTIDGRPALKLFRATPLQGFTGPGDYKSFDTMYVSPRTYDPIEDITRARIPGARTRTVQRWSVYRVLRATTANRRMLSLTALHPGAAIVHGARAYLRATQSQTVQHWVSHG